MLHDYSPDDVPGVLRFRTMLQQLPPVMFVVDAMLSLEPAAAVDFCRE